MIKLILIGLMFIEVGLAQTSTGIKVSQITPTVNLPVNCFIGLGTDGKFACVPLPTPPATSVRLVNIRPTLTPTSSGLTWILPSTPLVGTLVVARNGLIQSPGTTEDYTVAGNVITFTPQAQVQADDKINCMYEINP